MRIVYDLRGHSAVDMIIYGEKTYLSQRPNESKRRKQDAALWAGH